MARGEILADGTVANQPSLINCTHEGTGRYLVNASVPEGISLDGKDAFDFPTLVTPAAIVGIPGTPPLPVIGLVEPVNLDPNQRVLTLRVMIQKFDPNSTLPLKWVFWDDAFSLLIMQP